MGQRKRGPDLQRRTGAPGFFATTLPGLDRLLRQEIDAHPDLEPVDELGNDAEPTSSFSARAAVPSPICPRSDSQRTCSSRLRIPRVAHPGVSPTRW
ncbi:MAG: hypothetical protein ACRDRA_03370 [Pseudonocardiaceae bacterium]